MPELTEALRAEYQLLFDTCIIQPARYNAVDQCVQIIQGGKARYDTISILTRVPWYMIGILHKMECDCGFSRHLHNGDRLTARTVHVPKGRPKNGDPPFSFTDSAVDALSYEGFTGWKDWSIAGMLYCFEKYNGFGYRSKGIYSPYLWSFSNHYSKGKYTSDGVFDPDAVSAQIGTAIILRRMSELELIIAGEKDLVTQIRELGRQVSFDSDHYSEQAKKLQLLLNRVGQHLRTDGKAGRHTSDAYHRISGRYLQGDPIS